MSVSITLSKPRDFYESLMVSDIALLKDKKTLVSKWSRFNDGENIVNLVPILWGSALDALKWIESHKVRKGSVARNALIACYILDAQPQVSDLLAYDYADVLDTDALLTLNDGEKLNLEYSVRVQEDADEKLADQIESDLDGSSAADLTKSMVKRINASKDEWDRMTKNGLDVSVVLVNIDAQIRALETLKASL